jgi:hypothetical protein
MFQSIKYTRHLGYNAATDQYEYEYELIDSDFSCVVVSASVSGSISVSGVVIQEYSKRKLNSSTSCNVAANLIRFFRFYEKKWGHSIAKQIEWAEKYQHQFTPELKAELDKYLVII